jgi:hypothetical protein
MNTCAGGQKDAAVGSNAGQKDAAAGTAAGLQIGAGKRAWILAREAKRMQRGGQQRGPKICSSGQQCGCRLVPVSEHKYLRGRPKACSGGQQHMCQKDAAAGSSVAADWCRQASIDTCAAGQKHAAAG